MFVFFAQTGFFAQDVLPPSPLYYRAGGPRLNHVSDRGRTDGIAWSDRPEAISRSWCRWHGEGCDPAGLNDIRRDGTYCRGSQLRLGNLGFGKFSVNIYPNRVCACRLSSFDLLADSHSDDVEVELVGNGSSRVGGSSAVGQEARSSFFLCRG